MTSDEAISRTAVLNTLDTMDKALDENRTVEEYKELLRECFEQLPHVSVSEKDNKIRAELDRQEKWLLRAGYNVYNVYIAFGAIKAVLAESEEK